MLKLYKKNTNKIIMLNLINSIKFTFSVRRREDFYDLRGQLTNLGNQVVYCDNNQVGKEGPMTDIAKNQ